MNLGEFRSLFKARLNRTDCTDALADGFAEEAMSRAQRELRVPFMERVSVAAVESVAVTSFAVPADYLEVIDLYVDNVPLSRMSSRALLKVSETERPLFYARVAGQFFIRGAVFPGSTITLSYYGAVQPVADDASTNEVLSAVPDLLMYGALSAAGDHYQHEKTAEWEARYLGIREVVQGQADQDEMSGGFSIPPMYHDPGV